MGPWHSFQKSIWKKWSSQNWTKLGKNTELLIQIGIIFVKRASNTFMTHVIHFWNPQLLEISDLKKSKLGLFDEKIEKIALDYLFQIEEVKYNLKQVNLNSDFFKKKIV